MTALNLRQLSYLVAAADAGTMTGAAAALHVSQSAVSMAVTELERRLGVQLLLRQRAKGLTLTAAGQRLLPQARALLAQADELAAGAGEVGRGVTGRLVVGCFQTIAPFVLPPLLQGFAAEHPGVALDFVEGSLGELQRDLLAGRSEAALLYDLDIQPGIAREVVYPTRPYLLAAPDHPLARRAAVRLAELSGHDMVMLDFPPSEHYFGALLAGAGATPRIRHRTRSFEMVRSLVARGLGFGLLNQRPAVETSYEGLPLVYRPISDDIPAMPVVVATPAGARPTRRAEVFVRFCRDTARWRPGG